MDTNFTISFPNNFEKPKGMVQWLGRKYGRAK